MKTITDPEVIHAAVRQRYREIVIAAEKEGPPAGCCRSAAAASACAGCGVDGQAQRFGYTDADRSAIPEGANLGLGCGNPVAIASLREGETVVDLGAGAGFDAFLAARVVGPGGRVIGVDMTPEMVAKARANATKGGYTQVEFRLGEIEALPVADATADVVISNCVINLCPDQRAAYREAMRVLRPGGRLAVADVVAREPLPEQVQRELAARGGCVSGAAVLAELDAILRDVGFLNVEITPRGDTDDVITSWGVTEALARNICAAEVTATKPTRDCCASTCCR